MSGFIGHASPHVAGSEWTVPHGEHERQRLLAALLAQPGSPFTLSLAQVIAFDSAGVQLLAGLSKRCEAKGQVLRLEAATPPVEALLALYGLTRLLEPGAHA
jgi:anti-anti-sigma factor